MKKYSKLYSGLAIAAMTAIMSGAPIFMSEVQATDPATTSVTTNKMQHNEEIVMKGGYAILGSKFIGMKIENPQGDNLGEVKDIMLDASGKVRYAAVSYGGFMGLGDKLYAVPMDAFTFKRDKDMFYDDVILILNISEEQLENDQGFDDKNWPKLDDENYRKELDTRYNVNRY